MAMFGNKWAGIPRARVGTAGIGDDLPGNSPMLPPLDIPQINMPPAPQQGPQDSMGKPSFMGILADALAGAAGMTPQYAPMRAQQANQERQRQNALADYERKRTDEWDMWQRQQDYERANPKPVNNDTVNDYNFIASRIGPDAAKSYLQNLADGPPVAVDVANPDGSVTRQFLPRSSMMGNQQKGGDPASSGGGDMWGAFSGVFTPDELATIKGEFERRRGATHIPTGSPLTPNGVVTQRVGSKTYYQVNGKWYDNPEGR